MKINKASIIGIGIIWLVLVGLGMKMLLDYSCFPGISGNPPEKWITHSQMHLSPELPTLILFVHPHCPCSRASIGEFSKIITRCKDRLNAYVIFFKPELFPVKWVETDLWHTAKDIPGVKVICDNGGVEIRLFRALTSGHTLLYNTNGDLVFSGGITRARGHFGDNLGRNTIISFINKGTIHTKKTPTFGCLLNNKGMRNRN